MVRGPASPRHWWLLLAGVAVVSVGAAIQAGRLRIETDLARLFPDTPAVQDYRAFLERFGGFEYVYILVGASVEDGDDPDAVAEVLADAACFTADLIEESPMIASARCGLSDEEERFLFDAVLPHAPLLLDEERLSAILDRLGPDLVRERVRSFKSRLAGPMAEIEARLIAADPLGFVDGLEHLAAQEKRLPFDPVVGAFLSDDRRTALVIAISTTGELDSAAGHELQSTLDEAFGEVRASFDHDLAFQAVGGPLYAARHETVTRTDLIRTVLGSGIGIAVLLMLYFRGPRIPIAVLTSVALGVLWTSGILALARGRLSVVGISFAAILIGLGVDYGIHAAHAFRAELISGRTASCAIRHAVRTTGPAILASASTSVTAFLVLSLARFGPVRELGILVAVGVVAILASSLVAGAPLLALLGGAGDRRGMPAVGKTGPLWSAIERLVRRVVRGSARRWTAVITIVSAVTAVAVWGVTRVEVDADLQRLRPHDPSLERAERLLLDEFSVGLDGFSVVTRGDDLRDALTRAREVTQALAHVGGRLSVISPSDFLIEQHFAESRRAALERKLTPSLLAVLREELEREGFDPAAFGPSMRVLETLAAGREPAPIPRDAWPDWLERLVHVGPDGTFVAIQVSSTEDGRQGVPPESLVNAIHDALPTAVVASATRAGAELPRVIGRELRWLAGWCLLAVCLVVLVSFRGRFRHAFLSLVPVVVGTVWLLGLCGFVGLQINIFSVTVAPLLLGIGIDDGLHALHGIRVHGNLSRALERVGPAMSVTTLTTGIGFGSLALGRLPALRSGGLLIALGTLLCLLMSLVLLPALGEWMLPREGRSDDDHRKLPSE